MRPDPTAPPQQAGEAYGTFAARLWRSVMLLGWRPDEFWAATPAEVLGVAEAVAPIDLDALRERFPDG